MIGVLDRLLLERLFLDRLLPERLNASGSKRPEEKRPSTVDVDEVTRPIPGKPSGRKRQRFEELSWSSDDRRLGARDTSAAQRAHIGRGATRSRQTHRAVTIWIDNDLKQVYFIKLMDLDLV